MKKVIKWIIYLSILVLTLFLIIKVIEKNKIEYNNEYFNIEKYVSNVDKDNDGIDDQTDILESARAYIKTKPIYKSEYYATGYPNGEYGVCTDVVAFGMLNSGYDLMELVNQDIVENKELYNIETIDKNIDFRRVKNLQVYFKRHAISLTTDLSQIEEWQGGDIVVFKTHIGIVSDKRNSKGIPYLIHNNSVLLRDYEEDILELLSDEIVGHYRIS